jgi:flagellar motor switch protein FliN
MTTGSTPLREETKEIHLLKLPELQPGEGSGRRLLGDKLELIHNLKVRLSASVGQCELTVKELFELRENAVLTLNRDSRDPIDVTLDGRLIARGVLVAVDDCFGVKITEILAG